MARIRDELNADDSAGATRLPPPTGDECGTPLTPPAPLGSVEDALLFLELTRGGGMGRVLTVLGFRNTASGGPPYVLVGVS